jgi:signal transduction histidine kinase
MRILSQIYFYTGNEAELAQLLAILLDNAVKYGDAGGRINLNLNKQRKSVLLTVSNDFQAVGELPLTRLFDRFYRADSARSGGGYGLGLSIARRIAEQHYGQIQAVAIEQGEPRLMIKVTLPQIQHRKSV